MSDSEKLDFKNIKHFPLEMVLQFFEIEKGGFIAFLPIMKKCNISGISIYGQGDTLEETSEDFMKNFVEYFKKHFFSEKETNLEYTFTKKLSLRKTTKDKTEENIELKEYFQKFLKTNYSYK